jgi:hypothetical protein
MRTSIGPSRRRRFPDPRQGTLRAERGRQRFAFLWNRRRTATVIDFERSVAAASFSDPHQRWTPMRWPFPVTFLLMRFVSLSGTSTGDCPALTVALRSFSHLEPPFWYAHHGVHVLLERYQVRAAECACGCASERSFRGEKGVPIRIGY